MDKSLQFNVMKDMFISVISCNCFSLNGGRILHEVLQSLPTHLGFCLEKEKSALCCTGLWFSFKTCYWTGKRRVKLSGSSSSFLCYWSKMRRNSDMKPSVWLRTADRQLAGFGFFFILFFLPLLLFLRVLLLTLLLWSLLLLCLGGERTPPEYLRVVFFLFA